jgi:spermidine synthase
MSRSRFLATLALFIASGCAALIYEVVWFELLGLVIGATGVSLAILLTSFMGGMCLGSLALPRLVKNDRHPLRVYAVLELMIAACGFAILRILPALGELYWSVAGQGPGGLALRSILAAALLIPPTMLMGATLPAIARGVEATPRGLSRLGFAYGANTFGAVLGSLVSGFYLLRVYDVAVATEFAMGLNLLVAIAALWLAHRDEPIRAAVPASTPRPQGRSPRSVVYIAIALSGLTALGGEVVWTRLLSLLFGPTVYTFSIILAVFLAGLGTGSGLGAWLARIMPRPALGLAACQALLAVAIPGGAWMVVAVIPYWASEPGSEWTLWMRMAVDLGRAAAALLPATLLWGASFPLAVAAGRQDTSDASKLVAGVYASNTLGAIVGALWAGLVAIPRMGSHRTQIALALVSLASAVLVVGAMLLAANREEATSSRKRPKRLAALAAALVLVLSAGWTVVRFTPRVPYGLFAYGRAVDYWYASAEYLYVGQGFDADVVVAESWEGMRSFHVSGKIEASDKPIDLRTERMLGHLPAMIHSAPKRALVICCGAGITAGALTLYPSVERIVICEIEARVPEAAGKFFPEENYGVIQDPRTKVVIDDGRHFLASTDEKFDLITTDPIHPWVRGAAGLYTLEFFERCRAHLNPGGVVALWVPLYESNEPAVKCELATFLEVFPQASVWNSNLEGGGYDLTVVGSLDEQSINATFFARQLDGNEKLRSSLNQVDMGIGRDVMQTFVARGSDLADWLKGADINRDRNLRLQYLAGLTPNNYTEDYILDSLLAARDARRNMPK